MSFAFLPLYTGDYLRDTQHLSCSEHGIFLKLLMHCWDQRGPAPLDERKLCGIVNARSTDEIEAMRRVLSEFFIRMDDGHYNKRMTEEVAKAEGLSQVFREAGLKSANVRRAKARAGYAAKAEGRLNLGSTLAEPTLNQGSTKAEGGSEPPPPPPVIQITPPNPRKRGKVSELPSGFEAFWTAYPRKTAKAAASKAFARLRADDAMLEVIVAAVNRQAKSEQWRKDDGQFVPHAATWLNGRRWEDIDAMPDADPYGLRTAL